MISAIENVSHLRVVRWARIMGSNPYLTVTSCNVTCVRSMCIVITYCQLSGEGGVGEYIYMRWKTIEIVGGEDGEDKCGVNNLSYYSGTDRMRTC